MKKIIFLTIILMLTFSTITLAADFEFEGGFLYTTFDSDTLNEAIDGANEDYQNIVDTIKDDPSVTLNNFDKFDDLDSATGYWVGFRSDYFKNVLDLNYKIGVRYETFSNDVNANLHISNPEGPEYLKINDSLEIDVKGFLINGEKEINEYFAITGAIGYYYGEISFSYDEEDFDGEQTNKFEDSGSNDLEGEAGFKLGLSTNYPLSDNLIAIGNVSYRFLELDIEDSNESIDFDGLDWKAGLSYKF